MDDRRERDWLIKLEDIVDNPDGYNKIIVKAESPELAIFKLEKILGYRISRNAVPVLLVDPPKKRCDVCNRNSGLMTCKHSKTSGNVCPQTYRRQKYL